MTNTASDSQSTATFTSQRAISVEASLFEHFVRTSTSRVEIKVRTAPTSRTEGEAILQYTPRELPVRNAPTSA